MAINVSQPFKRTSANPIDDTIALTKAEMLTVNDNLMPSKYFTVCQDDGNFYLYDKSNTADPTTGKFRVFEGGGGGSYTAGDGIDITNDVISTKQSEEGDIDEIIDVYPQAGNLVSIVNAFNKGDIYSTEERMIGQWIDGKPLYQKTINTGMPSSEGVVHNISNLDKCVSMYGILLYTTDTYEPLPLIKTSSAYIRLQCTDTSVFVVQTGTFSNVEGSYVAIQYTKTTDSAISIGSTTEYSTDEKVVGTWIDGKPLYQKTITGTISVDTDKTSKTTTLGNVSEDLDVVASIDGIRQHENKSVFVSLNASAGASNAIYVCNLFVNSGTGNLVVEDNRLADNGRIILATVKYTKTTS